MGDTEQRRGRELGLDRALDFGVCLHVDAARCLVLIAMEWTHRVEAARAVEAWWREGGPDGDDGVDWQRGLDAASRGSFVDVPIGGEEAEQESSSS